MTLPFAAVFPRTLDALLARFAAGDAAGAEIEAWLFEDEAARRAAEAQLAAAGVSARIRCAYKPLVHAVLEEIDLTGAAAIEIAYPVHPAAGDRRFLLEAYPLAGMVDGPVTFRPRVDGGLAYEVAVTESDGTVRQLRVEAPNRVHLDHTGERVLSPTGWLRVVRDGATYIDERLETDYERLFETAIEAIAADAFERSAPFFDELRIEASLPFADRPLPVGDEAISLAEALHEDLYFSAVELLQLRSGRPVGDRGLQLGCVVPVVAIRPGDPTLSIALRPHARHAVPPARRIASLAAAGRPIGQADIDDALDAIGGTALSGRSVCGRAIVGRYKAGGDAAILVSAGQHANETTGIVGALRAGLELARRPDAHFAVLPLENPDGYALHRELCASQPRHMHHAARYTALGDDLEYRAHAPLFERELRDGLVARLAPGLHVNLHGYPAHEWTRPLTGYVPRDFALWTIPKGFFLILRHRPGLAAEARALVAHVAAQLATVPGLLALNARQIRLYEIHAGPIGFDVLGGIPVLISEDARHAVALTLITEFPDETIDGDAFRLGHEAQASAVVAAYDAWQAIARPAAASARGVRRPGDA